MMDHVMSLAVLLGVLLAAGFGIWVSEQIKKGSMTASVIVVGGLLAFLYAMIYHMVVTL